MSSSALSTATAVFTFHLLDRASGSKSHHRDAIVSGLAWLILHQNEDGGWGDTSRSLSNISTTALVWAALTVADDQHKQIALERAEKWLLARTGSLTPAVLAKAIVARYGKDHTFSVPILTMLTLAGRLGTDGWRFVPQLPFELAALPFRFFQWIQLPVVSYALPALIAIGKVRHHYRPTWNPFTRIARWLTRTSTLRRLREIQPTSGGYLEATPLTSFVSMSLIAAGLADHPVVDAGVRFLERSQRADGSWPIDTNLATWVTTLSINAILGSPNDHSSEFPQSERLKISAWLLGQQYRTKHPYTHAAPGGWAWTDLTGGVPDADDTPGALLALSQLGPIDNTMIAAATAGARWLLDLQNSDGGMPTFCRGWTGLPFDRSSADLTAHSLLAWHAWRDRFDSNLQLRIDKAVQSGLRYLLKTQHADGAWAPLWFGNQHSLAEVENRTYGTSRVLRLARLPESLTRMPEWRQSLRRGVDWLATNQNPDGGWGGGSNTPSTIEESALAIEGLASALRNLQDLDNERIRRILDRGLDWLWNRTASATVFPAEAIGFYFANLWYFEELYPLIFTTAAAREMAAIAR